MATATTTPMMTAVSTPPEPEVPGGDVAELEKYIHLKTGLLHPLSLANTQQNCLQQRAVHTES